MKKGLRITFNSPVILCFTALCFIATLLNYLTGGVSNSVIFMTYHSPLTDPLTYVRFVTHVFGHGDWAHFVGNASYLLLLGPAIEEKYKPLRVFEVIVITAVITGVVNYVVFPGVALCGASGIVFAFILMTSFTGFKEGEIPITFILVAVIFIGQQVYEGITIQDNVSNISHIIGGVIGGVAGYLLNKKNDTKRDFKIHY